MYQRVTDKTKVSLAADDLKELFPETWKSYLNNSLMQRLADPYEDLLNITGREEGLRVTGRIIIDILNNPPGARASEPLEAYQIDIKQNYLDPSTFKGNWLLLCGKFLDDGRDTRQTFLQNVIDQIRLKMLNELEKVRKVPDDIIPQGKYTENAFPKAASEGQILSAIDWTAANLTEIPRKKDLQ